MADFDPPFATNGGRRVPTSSEIQNGFPCGPADRELINWLFWSAQSEIGDVIDYAGLTGTNARMTQLREAILALLQNQSDGLASSIQDQINAVNSGIQGQINGLTAGVQTQINTLAAAVQALADTVSEIDTGGEPIEVPPVVIPPVTPTPPAEVPTIDTSQFITLPQARARLPFFPEATTISKTFGVTSPSTGTVRLPGGKTWLHRGIYPLSTTLIDFATSASKTYHVRWTPADGWALKDVSSASYNPESLPETDPSFDSSFDDMLIARVVTNSSNVATITNLINSNRLSDRKEVDTDVDHAPNWADLSNSGVTLNWARSPMIAEPIMQTIHHVAGGIIGNPGTIAATGTLRSIAVKKTTTSRYGCGNVQYSYVDSANNIGHLTFVWTCAAY